mgnify:CR=1 FL=1
MAGAAGNFPACSSPPTLVPHLVDQNIVIDNRPGGGGAVAYNFVTQREGNPYYIGTIGGSFLTTPLLGQSPANYKDFTPLAALAAEPYVLLVRAGSGLESLDAIAKRGTLRVGTTGVVTDAGLLAKMLEDALGIETRNIPFGGDGEVVAALLGDHIDIQFGNPGGVASQIAAGASGDFLEHAAQGFRRRSHFP